MHAWWTWPTEVDGPVVGAEADLCVLTTPASGHLLFWAMQASFSDGTHEFGAAHLGLQWWDRYAGSTAANWGGYDRRGTVLGGTPLTIPDPLHDGNTGAFDWSPGTTYRLRIDRGADGWQGSVEEVGSGERVVLRSLDAGGDRLTSVVVWAELFCRCDAQSVVARWSNFRVIDGRGDARVVDGAKISYQSVVDGGCANTNQTVFGDSLLQTSNEARVNAAGSVLRFS